MKRYLPFIIVAVVAMLTAGSGMMLYRAKQRALSVSGATVGDKSGLTPQHVRGGSDAPVTLQEFGDFQCAACAATTLESIRPLEKEYGARLRVIFWHFPLAVHQHGRDAALAAEAASLQARFWEMHDLLYQNQAAWSKAPDVRLLFDSYAQALHLDVERFRKDFESDQVAARVDRQREHGVSLGVKNTPTIFINDRELPPPFTPERLHEAVDTAMGGEKGS
jgi:protein-disulfide isomerase